MVLCRDEVWGLRSWCADGRVRCSMNKLGFAAVGERVAPGRRGADGLQPNTGDPHAPPKQAAWGALWHGSWCCSVSLEKI